MTEARGFLAINELPSRADESEVRRTFEAVTERARGLGVRPVETFFSLQRGRAYTYVEGDSPAHVREAFAVAGAPVVDVVPGARLFTDLLDEPHRYR